MEMYLTRDGIKILAVHVNRIDTINNRDQIAPTGTPWDLQMVFDDEDI